MGVSRKFALGCEEHRPNGAFIEIESDVEALAILEALHVHNKERLLKQGMADQMEKASPFASEPAAQAVLQLAADAARVQAERIADLETKVAALELLLAPADAS